jgi:hypothetical protein
MQTLTDEQAAKWCADRGFDLIERQPHWFDPRICNCLKFLTKQKYSVVDALVRYVVGSGEFDGAIVWATDWPFYSPDEMAVLDRLRSSIGEDRPLIESPAHFFDRQEVDDCVGLFNLCTHYYFDAFMHIPASGLLAYNSHDEIQYLTSLSATHQIELKAIAGRYDLEFLPTNAS